MTRLGIAQVALSALLLLAAQPAAADRLDEVKARGRLVVGVSDTSPPFSFKRAGEGTAVGYSLDIMHAVAKRLGVVVDAVSLSASERVSQLRQGRIDVVAASMTRTPERLDVIDFSYIYFVAAHAVIVRTSSGIRSVHELAGKRAVSTSTSTAADNLKEVVPTVDIVYARDYTAAFDMLKEGKVDAFPTDESVLRALVQQDGHPGDYGFLSDFIKSRDVGLGLMKNEPRFKDAINKALLDVEASGDVARIFDVWFGPASPEPMPRKFKIQAD